MRYEVVLDRGETANKCTIMPLAGRAGFRIVGVVDELAIPGLRSDLLLHPEGECLTGLRAKLGKVEAIAAVDCVWRRLPVLLAGIEGGLPTLARIPDGFVTAYPRKSEDGSDPQAGLATIEAIFTAAALLGNWDTGLLSQYYFGAAYVALNAALFARLGVSEALDPELRPVLDRKPRSALQRKLDRRHGFPVGVEV